MLPQTTPEQRQRFYGDVEALLNPGFLTHPVKVAGVRLQMRSLGSGDLFMLRSRTHGVDAWEWRVWAIATSIWMVNGRSVLGNDDAVPVLAAQLMGVPRETLNTMFSLLLGLWLRAGDATDAVQVYCHEVHSRYKWLTSSRGHALHGVPGAEALGQSVVRRIWTAHNEVEDIRRQDDTAWEGFKLVASSNAPKAIKKLDRHDQNRRKQEVARKQAEMDRWYYRRLGVINDQDEIIAADGSLHRFKGDKSVEDLEEEMRRWVTGDHDLHDRIVAEYKARIQAEHEARLAQQEEHRRMLEKKRQEMGWEDGDFKPQPLVALTAEQLQAALRARQGGRRPGVAFIPKAPQGERMIEKHVKPAATGNLQVRDGKVVDPSANPDADRRTLDQLIQSRNPSFSKGE